MTRILTLFFMLITLAACAPGSVIKDVPTGTPSVDEVVIVYQTSGGLAGITTTWTIYASGKMVNEDGKTIYASPEEVATLQADLIKAGFNTQVNSRPPSNNCADCTQTQLTVYTDGKPVTLTLVNESTDTPAAALDMVTMVNTFITEQQKQ